MLTNGVQHVAFLMADEPHALVDAINEHALNGYRLVDSIACAPRVNGFDPVVWYATMTVEREG